MEKILLLSAFLVLLVANSLSTSPIRTKRQLYYRDIISRPKLFRSRANEKDNTERTGHLPLSPLYPAEYDPVKGTSDYVPHHDNAPTKPKPIVKPLYYDPESFHPEEEYFVPLKPIYEDQDFFEHGQIFQESHHPEEQLNYHPSHEPMKHHHTIKPKPVYSEPHPKPKPAYSEQYHKPKPTYSEPHPKPYHKPKPAYSEPYHKPKPAYSEPYHKPKPAYSEPYHKPKPAYSESHPKRKRPHKRKETNSIPGKAGIDYPIYNKIPKTSFDCYDVPFRPGMYANPEAHCQVYHVCNDDRYGPQGASFLCTNGTIFNQETFSCDWWYNVDCNKAIKYYSLNTDPDHNPYFQKPVEEEYHHQKSASEHHQSSSSDYHPQPPKSHSRKKPSKEVEHFRLPSYESDHNDDPTTHKISSPFDSDFKHGSFFSPSSFDFESLEKQFSNKREVIARPARVREPQRQYHSSSSAPKRVLRRKKEESPREELSRREPSRRKPTIRVEKSPFPDYFPRSKDIYSREVANERAKLMKSEAKSHQRAEEPIEYPPLDKFSSDEQSSLYEWGKKLR